jgi:AcrR family transcriptional regulator
VFIAAVVAQMGIGPGIRLLPGCTTTGIFLLTLLLLLPDENQSVYFTVVSATTIGRSPTGRGGRGARKRIRTAAATLFYRDGIQATGVQRLTQEANVSKRTFYQHFASKTDLVEEYLRGIHEAGGTLSERAIDTDSGTPRQRLLAIFDGTPVDRVRGCPFHNAAVESAGAMRGVDDIVHAHKLEFIERLIQAAAQAGATDPYHLGHQLAVLFEGAKALATTLNDTSPLVHARSAAEALIDAATDA